MKSLVVAALVFALGAASTLAAEISLAQKDAICRTSLARINANASAEYKSEGVVGSTFSYKSAKGYLHECEVFSDGMAFTLSSKDWGRLKPTGSATTEGKCSAIKLFDPGFGVTHGLKVCTK